MIADAIGVTKAAVYHQFKTKDEIVLAVAQAELANLEAAIDAAEAEPDPDPRARRARDAGWSTSRSTRRRMESMLLGDPVIVRFFAQHEPYRKVMRRMYRMLAGDRSATHGCPRRCSPRRSAAP